MPCSDYSNAEFEIVKLKEQKIFVEKILFGVLIALEKNSINIWPNINWKEIGINRDLANKWWVNIKAEYFAKHYKEKKELEQANIRKKALAKLTDEEIKILGIVF